MQPIPEDRSLLNGETGPAQAFAMALLVRMGQALGAPHFIPIYPSPYRRMPAARSGKPRLRGAYG